MQSVKILWHKLRDERWRLIVWSILAVLSLSGAGLAWRQESLQARSSAIPLDNPLANLNELGVNVNLEQYEPDELAQVLADIRAAGLRWVRQRFPWSDIQPQPDRFEWDVWDRIVQSCHEYGLELIAVLDQPPDWAVKTTIAPGPTAQPTPLLTSLSLPASAGLAATPTTEPLPTCRAVIAVPQPTPFASRSSVNSRPPQEAADWGRFVAAFAQRFRGQIAAYQLWHEPNLAEHWGGQYVDPAAFTVLLREGAIHIRQADPGAPILLAALAPTTENGPLNLNEVAFVRGVLAAGGRPFFDALALQPLGMGDSPDQEPSLNRLSFGRIGLARQALADMGLADVPVWATAWGWNVLLDDQAEPSQWGAVSSSQQVDYTLAAIQMARRQWPWLGPMILYTWQPNLPLDDPRWGFALRDAAGQFSPLYHALEANADKKTPLPIGVYVPSEQNATLVGEWRFAPDGADPPHLADAAQRNATLSFDFAGTALDLRVRRGDFWGVFYIQIDGRPAWGLPREENGLSYLVLYDPDTARQGETVSVRVAQGLSSQQGHHIEIVAHGGWGQWPLVGWTVWGQEPSPPRHRISVGLLIVAVLAMLAAAVQFLAAPLLARPIYAMIGGIFRRYRALPEWIPVSATLTVALVFYFSPWTPLSMLLLVVLWLLVFLRIDLGLSLVALSLPFYLAPKTLLGRPFSIIELGLAVCLSAWLVARLLDWGRGVADGRVRAWLADQLSRWREWPERLRRSLNSRARLDFFSLDAGMVALLLTAWLAAEGAARQDVAWREFRVVFVDGALFYALIRLAVRSERARQRLVDGWLLGAVAVAATGIGQAIVGQNLITTDAGWRVRGLYGSPNNLALYLERALPMLVSLTVLRREPRWARWAGGAVALIVLGALTLTFSKGALLLGLPTMGLILGGFVWPSLALRPGRRRWRIWGTLAGAGILIVVVGGLVLSGQMAGWFQPGSGTGFFRLKLWQSSLAIIGDYPLTGVGLDNFLYLYRSRYVLPSAWNELNLSHPHNVLLDAWTRLGLWGVLALSGLLFTFFRTALLKCRTATSHRPLLVGAITAVGVLLAHGLVDQALFLPDLSLALALLLALTQNL